MMRFVTIALPLALFGCSSSTPEPAPADTGGADPFGTTGATGVFGTRDDACTRVVAALNKRATELGCNLLSAKCPDMVDDLEQRAGVAGQCMDYDLGTVTNCEARIATYSACSDFQEKGCQLGLRRSLTNYCSTADAGQDAPSEGG